MPNPVLGHTGVNMSYKASMLWEFTFLWEDRSKIKVNMKIYTLIFLMVFLIFKKNF